ncbi:MAG: tRNA dihydrouridine synthase DusB [Chloroflexi bacterium]|nr:tRNA dihydrouridine synthase DusB [Chloroflexota bacterium]
MKQEPTFWVRDVPIYGDAILSPMAGFSDVPYRALCRAFGSAMNYTEFVPVDSLQGKRNPLWNRLNKKPDEHPIVFQIFGNNAQMILRGAQRIEELGPDIIDINMGCSTRKVSGRGAGVGMMIQPDLVAETFRLLTTHLSVPVTGKIRLGWDDDRRNFLEIAKIMEDNGASLVALHARTKEQKYNYAADWDAIAELKQAMSVPVIGNGDVRVPADIEAMKAHTGCDAVMIGRAAVGNPWIFARKDRADLSVGEIADTVRLHLREMLAYYGNPDGLVLFRKHLRRYFSGYAVKRRLRPLLVTEDTAVFEALLQKLEQELEREES